MSPSPRVFASSALAVALVSTSGCSLLVPGPDDFEYCEMGVGCDPIDGGSRDDGGGADGGADAGIDAGPGAPAVPVLRAPRNGFMTGSVHTGAEPAERNALRPRFLWEPAQGAERYEIQLTDRCDARMRDTCDFASATSTEVAEASYRPAGPLAVSMTQPVGRRYVWRVRACSVAGCSDWSPARYLDVGRLASDVNGDGYGDLVVGAPFETGSVGQGTVQASYGPDLVLGGSHQGITSELSEGLGYVLTLASDVNADGYPDVVAGAPLSTAAGQTEAGALVLFLGARGGLAPVAAVEIESPSPVAQGHFAWSVAGGGDVDADGYADVLVGAPGEMSGASGAGRAYLFLGSGAGLEPTSHRSFQSPSPTTDGRFGAAVSVASDLDGDGRSDVVIGAPGESGLGAMASGAVYVHRAAELAVPLSVFSPTGAAGGSFGAQIAGGRDLDGDGRDDLAVGAVLEENATRSAGRVHLFAGTSDGVDVLRSVESPLPMMDAGFGASLELADVTGDGFADLVVSSPGGATGGQVHLFENAGGTIQPVPSASAAALSSGDSLGFAVGATDFSGDGMSTVSGAGVVLVFDAGLANPASVRGSRSASASGGFGASVGALDGSPLEG